MTRIPAAMAPAHHPLMRRRSTKGNRTANAMASRPTHAARSSHFEGDLDCGGIGSTRSRIESAEPGSPEPRLAEFIAIAWYRGLDVGFEGQLLQRGFFERGR